MCMDKCVICGEWYNYKEGHILLCPLCVKELENEAE